MTNSNKFPNQCHSCLLPFANDPGQRESDKYCSYCYRNGELCFKGTKQEFIKFVYGKMREKNIPWLKAKFYSWLINWAPRWRK
jgi:hypothetical protein